VYESYSSLLIPGLSLLALISLTLVALIRRGRFLLLTTIVVWLTGLGVREFGQMHWLRWVISECGLHDPEREAFLSGLQISLDFSRTTALPLLGIAVVFLALCWWGFMAKTPRKGRGRLLGYLLIGLLVAHDLATLPWAYYNFDYPVLSLSTEPAWRAGIIEGFKYYIYSAPYVLAMTIVFVLAVKRGFRGRIPAPPSYQQPSQYIKEALTR